MESHSSFCSPFSPAEFLAAASNLFSSSATCPDQVAYSMLKHLPRTGMDFLFHIFNLSWTLYSFPSIWKTSSLLPFTKWESLSTLLLPSGLSLSPPAYQSCLNASFHHVYSSFWSLIPLSPTRQAGFCPGRSILDHILYLSQSISDEFNKPRPGSRTIFSTIDFSKAFDFVWHPALFHKLISADFLPCFARWDSIFPF